MKKYICTEKCYYKKRLWTPGESLESDDSDVPKFFSKESEASKKIKPKKPVEEPKTMKDLHNAEMKSLLIGTPKDDDMFN